MHEAAGHDAIFAAIAALPVFQLSQLFWLPGTGTWQISSIAPLQIVGFIEEADARHETKGQRNIAPTP